MKILVIHGLGMDMRGVADVDLFGPMTLPQYDKAIYSYAAKLGIDVSIFHSNEEDEVVARFAAAGGEGFVGALFNPSGYMAGYPSLTKAITDAPFPVYELHMSNPFKRGRTFETARACTGVVQGFGIEGYRMVLSALTNSLPDA